MKIKYSVLIPLYIKDNPNWAEIAINSMINQSVPADEIIILCDGKLTDIQDNMLERLSKESNIIRVIKYKKNRGLGLLLSDGIQECRNELIFRMDADDYSVPERCEKQLKFMIENPDYDLISSNTLEFIDSIDNIVSNAIVPEKHEEIYRYAKRRNPMRHPAFLYKKSKVISAGNYLDLRRNQDYDLVVRMLKNNYKMYNIQEYLVYMRVNQDYFRRRGGLEQAKEILRLKWRFLRYGFFSYKDFIISGFGHAFVCLLPNSLREYIYKKILRG